MKEKDYINATDLQKVWIIKHLLKDIIPENSKDIPDREHEEILRRICVWEERLRKRIEKS
jgi:hypothetical protein